MPPIPPPIGLPPPPRQVRALRRTAQGIAIGVTVVVVGLIGYGVYEMLFATESSTAQQQANAPADSATPDVLRSAPAGGEIKARRTRVAFIPPGAPPPTPTPTATETTQQGGMTDAEVAGRQKAWDAYYQATADLQQKRVEARRAGMASDFDVTPIAATGAPGSTATSPPNTAQPGTPTPQNFFAANASSPSTDYSPFTTTNPISPYELKATDTITAKLVSAVNSDSPGIIKALVTKSVMDHATGMHILIPQGSTLVGFYDTSVAYGQSRLTVAWTRVLYPPPCDQSLDLGAMSGGDETGSSGMADTVNNHLGKVFTSAILVSVFGAAAQLSQPPQSAFSSYSPYQSAAGAVGQQMSQLGAQIAQKGLSVPPTIEVRSGFNATVLLTKDIAFEKPWIDGVCDPIDVDVAQ